MQDFTGFTGREWGAWKNMLRRCINPDHPSYHNYGGRGIKVCKRWGDYWNFAKDMGPCRKGLSLDRINPNGNYTPKNCRWATTNTQARNTRRSFTITFNGETMDTYDWAKRTGLSYSIIRNRYRVLEWSPEDTLTTPKGVKPKSKIKKPCLF